VTLLSRGKLAAVFSIPQRWFLRPTSHEETHCSQQRPQPQSTILSAGTLSLLRGVLPHSRSLQRPPVLPALFAMGRRSEATASGRLKQRGGWPRCPEAFPDILSLLVYRNSVEHLACYAFDDRDESTQWLLQNHRMLGVGRDLCGSIKAAAGVTFLLTLGKRVKTHTLWETAASAEDDHVGW